MPRLNPLEDTERIATDQEAREALRDFFESLSPSEFRRMYQCFLDLHRRRITKLAAATK